MKKQFTFALMILLCAISTINAQVKNHLDTDLKQKHNKHNAQSVSERGALFLLKQKTSTYFTEEGKSDGKSRTLYTHNNKGLLTEELAEEYDSIAKVWNKEYRVLTVYDAKNNITSESVEDYDLNTKVWISSYRYLYVYDTKNNIISELFEDYDKLGKYWTKYSKVNSVYNPSNNVKLDTIFFFSESVKDSISQITYRTYEYDNSNRLTVFNRKRVADLSMPNVAVYLSNIYSYGSNGEIASVSLKDKGTTPTNLKNKSVNNYTYTLNNDLASVAEYLYVNDVLSTSFSKKTSYVYNSKNQLSLESYEAGVPVVERSKELYYYDSNGNLSNKKIYNYDNTAKKLYYGLNVDYLYSQFVDTKDIQTISFSVSPNPASEVLTVKATEPILSSTIYDMNGRVLSVTQGDFSSLDIAYLSEGVYFLQVKTQTGMGTTKFIKK